MPPENRKRQWCSCCKTSTHKVENCRRWKKGNVKQATDAEDNEHKFVFKANDCQFHRVEQKGLMDDTGSHITTDIGKFKQFDDKFQPEKHYTELAYGTRTSGVALRRGDVEVCLIDSEGHQVKATVHYTSYTYYTYTI